MTKLKVTALDELKTVYQNRVQMTNGDLVTVTTIQPLAKENVTHIN